MPTPRDARLEPPIPGLPEGRALELRGRGRTWVRDIPGPHPGAPVVLLLHGLTATADLNFATCYGALARRCRVVAMDHRGHGRGIRTLRPFRLEDCADDAAALCAALDLPPVIAVGYSMGGPVTQLLWRRHREAVAGMVLCATAARFVPSEDARRHAVTAGLLGASLAARFASPIVRSRAVAGYVGKRVGTDPDLAWAREQMGRHDPALVLQAAAALTRFDSRAWLGEVDVPTAVVRTGLDRLVPPHRQDELAQRIPGASVVQVQATHVSVVDAPQRFVPGLVRAVQQVADRTRVAAA